MKNIFNLLFTLCLLARGNTFAAQNSFDAVTHSSESSVLLRVSQHVVHHAFHQALSQTSSMNDTDGPYTASSLATGEDEVLGEVLGQVFNLADTAATVSSSDTSILEAGTEPVGSNVFDESIYSDQQNILGIAERDSSIALGEAIQVEFTIHGVVVNIIIPVVPISQVDTMVGGPSQKEFSVMESELSTEESIDL